jgi:glycosyltransferase involved in cell wall biosynthesis
MEHRAARLGSLENVELPGPVPVGSVETARVLARFSAGVIPFRTGFVGDAINPVKMYEYLAHGLPVIASPIRECRERQPLVRCASTPDEWAAAVNAAVTNPRRGVRDRLEYARANTWDERALAMIRLLGREGLFPGRTRDEQAECS